jgi:hypothetical protein
MLQGQGRTIASGPKKHGMAKTEKRGIAQKQIKRDGINGEDSESYKQVGIVDTKNLGVQG